VFLGWWIVLLGRDIEHIQTCIANMAAMANEVLEFAGPEDAEEAHGESSAVSILAVTAM
jgi:hypothetical protein